MVCSWLCDALSTTAMIADIGDASSAVAADTAGASSECQACLESRHCCSRLSDGHGRKADVVAPAQSIAIAGRQQQRWRQAAARSQCGELLALGGILGATVRR